MFVFVAAQILPGDVGRRILGRDASPEAVAALNEELGTDRPILVQYWDWVSGFVRGDLGESYNLRVPVSDLVVDALGNSFKLALVKGVLEGDQTLSFQGQTAEVTVKAERAQ